MIVEGVEVLEKIARSCAKNLKDFVITRFLTKFEKHSSEQFKNFRRGYIYVGITVVISLITYRMKQKCLLKTFSADCMRLYVTLSS